MSFRFLLEAAPMFIAVVLARGTLRLVIDRWSAALLVVALACLTTIRLAPDLHTIGVVTAFAAGMTALVRTIRASSSSRWPAALAAVGCLCNIAPIAVYGAMPVRAQARIQVSARPIAEPAPASAKHVEVSGNGPLTLLGDTIPVQPLGMVLSIGDLMVLASLGGLGLAESRRLRQARNTSTGSPTGPRRALPVALLTRPPRASATA
jgi:hypothetical protein